MAISIFISKVITDKSDIMRQQIFEHIDTIPMRIICSNEPKHQMYSFFPKVDTHISSELF